MLKKKKLASRGHPLVHKNKIKVFITLSKIFTLTFVFTFCYGNFKIHTKIQRSVTPTYISSNPNKHQHMVNLVSSIHLFSPSPSRWIMLKQIPDIPLHL